MTRAFPILLLACLTSCSNRSMLPETRLAPVPPPLPAALAAPCPEPVVLVDKSIGEISQKDIDVVLDYHECRLRQAGAVNAFNEARDAAIEWNKTSVRNSTEVR